MPSKKKALKKLSKEQLTIAVLCRARDLISKRGGWTRDAFAEAKNGSGVSPTSPEACKFCALGAVRRAVYDLTGTDDWFFNKDFRRVETILGSFAGGSAVSFNDSRRTKKPVVELFNKAIAKLEAKANA